MKPSTDPKHARRTPTPDTTKMKNTSMTFSRIAKMSLNDDEHPKQIQKFEGPTSISNLTTLTPNQGNKSYTMPVPTRTIPEVSTIADSLSPMTFNDTDQLHEDNSEFAHMRRTTEAEKGYKKAAPVDKVGNNSHQTSDKLFSTPLEPYPHTAPSMTTATDASTVRVIMGSRLYESESNLQPQLYDPEPKSTLQLDDNQDVDSQGTDYDFESDNDEGNKGNTTMETTEHHTKLKEMERDISNQSKEAALMKQKIKKLETKADSYEIHADNWSKDREVRMRIKGKRSKIMDKLWEMNDTLEIQDKTLEDLQVAKDKLFDVIRDMKMKINEVVELIDEQDGYVLTNRKNISIMSQNMQEMKKEHSGILSRLQEHSFKLNASNTFTATKPWMLKSDSDTYPILKIFDVNTKFGTFAPLLFPIKLEGDKMMDIKKFYEEINVTLMTTLSSMVCLPEYKELTSAFDIATHLVPPEIHTQHIDARNAYKQFSRTLLLHLQQNKTISPTMAPRAALILQENMLEECGFKVLFKIIKELSPQLGGEFRDLQEYVKTLKINDGEPVLEYYLRAVKMSQEINIQGDKTGQNNRLIHRFIALLFAVPAFTECMRQPMKAITSFFRSPDNHVMDFQESLQEIYNAYIKDNCAPTFITAKVKYLPPHP